MDANTTDDQVRGFLTYVRTQYDDTVAEQIGGEIRRKIELKETFDEFQLLWEKSIAGQGPMPNIRFTS